MRKVIPRIPNKLFNACNILVMVAVTLFIVLPTPYVIEKPGPSANVLGSTKSQSGEEKELITVADAASRAGTADMNKTATADKDGEIMLLTVSVMGGPGGYLSNVNVLGALFNPTRTVLPVEALFKPNETAEESQTENLKMMTDSQQTAVKAAAKYLESRGVNLDLNGVHIQIDDVGGPSAGLAFTLGVLQKAARFDITKGRKIATTGTISEDGKVGSIGGVQQKMLGAQAAGATVFVCPEENLRELRNIPAGLEVVGVGTLADTLEKLGVAVDSNSRA